MPTPELTPSPAAVPPSRGHSRGVAGVVLAYALFAGLWILVSDRVVEWLFRDPEAIIRASTLKGGLFVLVTSLLLYGLVRRRFAQFMAVEAALKDSEERYRMAFRTSPDAININRCADGCYLDVNDGFERMTGWQRAEVVGHSSLAIGIWHDPDDRLRLLQSLSRDGYCENLEAEFVMNDGAIRHGLMSAHIIQLSGEACILSITRDVTEKTRAEAALRESEARYRSVVDNIKEVIFQTDAQGLWTFLNPAWAEVTGFSVEESLGHLFLDYVLPEDRQRNAELFEPLVQRKKDECHHEIRYVHKDGGYRWIEVCARLTLDDQGGIIGTSGTLSDITERRAVAESLRRQSEELARHNRELERFNRATVGRELDMIELKKQVNALSRELGREPPFSLSFLDESAPEPPAGKS